MLGFVIPTIKEVKFRLNYNFKMLLLRKYKEPYLLDTEFKEHQKQRSWLALGYLDILFNDFIPKSLYFTESKTEAVRSSDLNTGTPGTKSGHLYPSTTH